MRRGPNLATLAVAISMAIGIAPAALGHESTETTRSDEGLGVYGRDGEIQRADVPLGVTDETLHLLNTHPDFQVTRGQWDQAIDFASQAEQQFIYRRAFGYNTDPGHVATVMRGGEHTVFDEGIRIWLTEAEAHEKQRRELINEAMDDVARLFLWPESLNQTDPDLPLEYVDSFGGIMQDHADAGRIKLHLVSGTPVDRAGVESLVPTADDLEIVFQPYGWNELHSYLSLAIGRAEALGLTVGGDIEMSDEGALVALDVPDESSHRVDGLIADIPSDAVTIRPASWEAISNPGIPHSTSLLKPGLALHLDGNKGSFGCTWGMNANTSSYYYGVTAAHCFRSAIGPNVFAGWIEDVPQYSLEVYQEEDVSASGALLTAGNTYTVWKYTTNMEAGRFESGYADDNCYHAGSDSCWQIIQRAWLNSVDVGDGSCASTGFSGIYKCGDIESNSYQFSQNGVSWNRLLQVDFQTTFGDSGGGLIDGVQIHALDGILIQGGPGASTTLALQAYDALQSLGTGANFNCKISGNKGTVCPGVSR